MNDSFKRLKVLRDSDVQLLVSTASQMAISAGMNTGAAAALSTAVSELLTNVIKYAKNGRISLRTVQRRGQPGIEAVVEDSGPGIEDVDMAMKENVSSGGSLGLGLPGTRRLVDEFTLETTPGKGTRIRIIKWG